MLLGGNKEDFLKLINNGINKWLENVEKCKFVIEKISRDVGRTFDVSPAELWRYITAESYENDLYKPQDILQKQFTKRI